jgi:hypothetical protein
VGGIALAKLLGCADARGQEGEAGGTHLGCGEISLTQTGEQKFHHTAQGKNYPMPWWFLVLSVHRAEAPASNNTFESGATRRGGQRDIADEREASRKPSWPLAYAIR